MPGTKIHTVFDVGANVGETVARYREANPDARIWAFEPVRASYQVLFAATSRLHGVHAFNVALGGTNRTGLISARGTSDQNTLVTEAYEGEAQPVDIITGDAFCKTHGIEHISLLKIDTEGGDLDVLRGFHGMLGDARIDLILVEAGMHAKNLQHVPLERFKGYLEPIGYAVFRFYRQSAERRGGPHLRRADVMFVSPRLIERYAGSRP